MNFQNNIKKYSAFSLLKKKSKLKLGRSLKEMKKKTEQNIHT
jgi:hypothetical protein